MLGPAPFLLRQQEEMMNAAYAGDVAAMAALGAKNPRLLVEPVKDDFVDSDAQCTALHWTASEGHATGA